MDILINSIAANRTSLGVRRYFRSVLQCLESQDEIRYTGVPPLKFLERTTELLLPGRKDAILWSPSHRGPLFARNHVVTVHDCINVEYAHRGDRRLPIFRKMCQQMFENAQAIVAISSATRDALHRNYIVDASKIVVIRSPLDVAISAPILPKRADQNRPYILMVVNSFLHKNTVRACRALTRSSALRRGVSLRIVGSIAPEARVICEEAGLVVEFHAGVDDVALANLYAHAIFLFSPSIEEGHNLPIAEALSCGGNVLCTDIPVHREFYDGLVRFCDPYDIASMTASIEEALSSNGSWQISAPPLKRRSFRDVANEYHALFDRISIGNLAKG